MSSLVHVKSFGFKLCLRFRFSKTDILRRNYGKTSIKSLLSHGRAEESAKISGWVKRASHQKDVTFLQINDGSSAQNLQLVMPAQEKKFHFGDCIQAEGALKDSPGKQQKLEMHVDSWKLHGSNDIEKNRKLSPKFEDVRTYLDRRIYTPQIAAMLRIRSAATLVMHEFFKNEGFFHIHTPIITTNDCEGAGETFQINLKQESTQAKINHFFDHSAFLTVSAQLHLEMISHALSRVYTFSPTFRGENSRTRQHLSEFYMLEAELAFTESLTDVIDVIEKLVKSTTQSLLDTCSEDISLCHSKSETKQPDLILNQIMKSKFQRMTYSEAIDILQKQTHFKFKAKWGIDLQKEHEFFLVEHCGGCPVFVTDFPAAIKPFYMRTNSDNKTVAAVDLLVPEVGELCGGSLREERYDLIKDKISPDLTWYADMRQFGTFPHGGFGLGFDRYLMVLLGVKNIRDVVIFPRWSHNCQF